MRIFLTRYYFTLPTKFLLYYGISTSTTFTFSSSSCQNFIPSQLTLTHPSKSLHAVNLTILCYRVYTTFISKCQSYYMVTQLPTFVQSRICTFIIAINFVLWLIPTETSYIPTSVSSNKTFTSPLHTTTQSLNWSIPPASAKLMNITPTTR